jgi:hypothetical protein
MRGLGFAGDLFTFPATKIIKIIGNILTTGRETQAFYPTAIA